MAGLETSQTNRKGINFHMWKAVPRLDTFLLFKSQPDLLETNFLMIGPVPYADRECLDVGCQMRSRPHAHEKSDRQEIIPKAE